MNWQESRVRTAAPAGPGPSNRLWLLACVLLGLVQVQWAGYQLGAGNQSIQVAFLQRLHDPALFAQDEMVSRTLPVYPSLFYRVLAPGLGLLDFQDLYLALHVLTAIGLFVAVACLARAIFGSHWAGLVVALFLVSGHHQALAEQPLYSNGFTHTWAVYPVVIGVLALWYAGRTSWAFGLTGLLANAHALEAAQLGFVLGLWALGQGRRLGWRKVLGWLVLMGLGALPAAILMVRAHQSFDGTWLELMRVRSALHSFPSSWWRAGNPDLPRFALLIALAALAVSLDPDRRRLGQTLWLGVAVGVMFLAGWCFTELWPNATVVRAQLFRSSRFLMMVLLVYVGWGCVRAIQMWCRRDVGERWRAGWELASAMLTAVVLVVESALVLLPVAVLVATLVALINRRLTWHQALVSGTALLVSLLAWRQIHFILPGLSPEFSWQAVGSWAVPEAMLLLALGAVLALWWLSVGWLGTWTESAVAAAAAGAAIGLTLSYVGGWRQWPAAEAAWFATQAWARQHTPATALFLTPAQTGGFRILSGRSVVAEWRDGTQLFFSAAYAKPWWERMNALQPGLRLTPDKRRLLVRGKQLGQLDDESILALARQYQATHIVLPAVPARRLRVAYTNEAWAVYLPSFAPPANPTAALLAEQTQFLRATAEPNIQRHRQGDVHLQVQGPDGRPLYDVQYQVRQRASAFRFGVGLSDSVLADSNRLAQVSGLFNYTVLREASRWDRLEPVAGQRQTAAADALLRQCAAQGLAVEWSALTAWPPAWAQRLDQTKRPDPLWRHIDDLLGRFGPQVDYWQLSDQQVWLESATNHLAQLRAKYPGIKIGLGDTGRFWSAYQDARRAEDLCRGLAEARQLGLDYLSLHGHQPFGVWADAATIYEVLDACAKAGLPVHITAFAVPATGVIEGHFRRGHWDLELQAEYARFFYTVAFSHPNVQALNYAELGPETRLPEIGLLGPAGQPRPIHAALRELILQQWRTNLAGKLPLDGRLEFRGFHGEYELLLSDQQGQTARAGFTVAPGGPTRRRFVGDLATGRLEVTE